MTVEELVDILIELPPDALIRVGGYGSTNPARDVEKADWIDDHDVYVIS